MDIYDVKLIFKMVKDLLEKIKKFRKNKSLYRKEKLDLMMMEYNVLKTKHLNTSNKLNLELKNKLRDMLIYNPNKNVSAEDIMSLGKEIKEAKLKG